MLLALPALAPWSQIAPLAFRIEAALWGCWFGRTIQSSGGGVMTDTARQ
jgi:hypothetical protein